MPPDRRCLRIVVPRPDEELGRIKPRRAEYLCKVIPGRLETLLLPGKQQVRAGAEVISPPWSPRARNPSMRSAELGAHPLLAASALNAPIGCLPR